MRNDTMIANAEATDTPPRHDAEAGGPKRSRGPRAWWTLAATGMAALLVATVWGLASMAGLAGSVDHWERAAVPGEVEITVEQPGEMVVRSETTGAVRWGRPDGSLDVSVAGPRGQPVAVDEVGFAGEYRVPGRAGRAVATFEAEAPGTYRVVAAGEASSRSTFAVGEPLWPGALAGAVGAATLGAVGLFALIGGVVGGAGTRGAHRSGSGGGHHSRPVTDRGGISRLVVYAALALALSWAVWIPGLVLLGEQATPLVMLGAFGPAVAAAIMVRAEGGSIRGWLRRIVFFRVPKRWFLVALAIPLIEPAVVAAAVAATGGPITLAELPARLPFVLAGFVIVLIVGGGQEEFGWRGYLLPRLQSRVSPLLASVAIGVLWAVWHLPLFALDMPGYTYDSIPFAAYLPIVVSLSVTLTWLFNHTGGSVVLAMLLHAAFNSWDDLVPVPASLQLDGRIEVLAQMGVTAGYGLLALALVAMSGTRLGAKLGHDANVGKTT